MDDESGDHVRPQNALHIILDIESAAARDAWGQARIVDMVCRLPHLLSHARLMIADAPLFCKACIEFVTLLSGLHDAKQLSLSYSICAGGVPGKSHRSPFDLPSEASFVLPTPLSKQKPSKMIVKMRELISTPPEKSLHASNLGWAVRSCVAEMDSLECESEIPARVVVVVHDSFSRVDDALAPGLDNPTNTVQLIRINVSDEQKPPSESDETMRTSGLADGSGDDNDDDAAAALSFSQSTAPSAQRNIVMEPEEDCFGMITTDKAHCHLMTILDRVLASDPVVQIQVHGIGSDPLQLDAKQHVMEPDRTFPPALAKAMRMLPADVSRSVAIPQLKLLDLYNAEPTQTKPVIFKTKHRIHADQMCQASLIGPQLEISASTSPLLEMETLSSGSDRVTALDKELHEQQQMLLLTRETEMKDASKLGPIVAHFMLIPSGGGKLLLSQMATHDMLRTRTPPSGAASAESREQMAADLKLVPLVNSFNPVHFSSNVLPHLVAKQASGGGGSSSSSSSSSGSSNKRSSKNKKSSSSSSPSSSTPSPKTTKRPSPSSLASSSKRGKHKSMKKISSPAAATANSSSRTPSPLGLRVINASSTKTNKIMTMGGLDFRTSSN